MDPVRARIVQFFEIIPGRFPALDDLDDLKDKRVREKIEIRILRAKQGNYGTHRRIGDFIELIADFGPGHRIYLGEDGAVLIIILVVGDKSTQVRDFKEANAYWEAYKGRKRRGTSHAA